jgi:hypothetical protein
METATVAMLEAAGISPAWIYAGQNTGGLLPRPDGTFATASDRAEWDEAVSRYAGLHQPGGLPDYQAETRKLRSALAMMTVQMAADDPATGRRWLPPHRCRRSASSDAAMVREFLHDAAGYLDRQLAARPGVRAAVGEYARAWASADLAVKLASPAPPPPGDPAADAALLAAAVAVAQDQTA